MPSPVPLPEEFLERFKKILPPEQRDSVFAVFGQEGPLSVRVNTLKTSVAEIRHVLAERGVDFSVVSWYPQAFVLKNIERSTVVEWDLIKEGKLYLQALSSMLPVLALAPNPGERILDFCAAPGSKTTQIAAFMQNEGVIVALEAIKGRFYRLRSVLEILGVKNTSVKLLDARRFRDQTLFDRILVDAPCSSEGRFKLGDAKSFGYWSPRKIKEMAHKQKGLLLTATRLLKPGGVLVYSTCTFAPEENEEVIDWCLRKTDGMMTVESISFPDVLTYPALTGWGHKEYASAVKNCLRILPTKEMEGFFIAKLVKSN